MPIWPSSRPPHSCLLVTYACGLVDMPKKAITQDVEFQALEARLRQQSQAIARLQRHRAVSETSSTPPVATVAAATIVATISAAEAALHPQVPSAQRNTDHSGTTRQEFVL